MSDDEKLTHQDWERALSLSDIAAYECTLHVLAADFESARASAERTKAFKDEMDRISKALEAQEPS
ncbi:hypothetical protein [Pseudarthrobacter cellobiosi]|uniref:hypothetical protein n=1 Tax=Pseudarthrobacter cellobiosi TaxID=2953654 RepID=UPI00208FAA92|nr:hypothetical protein [Pseudarthrobacter sp. HLT1-5]MCO4256481.1 hypothetical protein [Pseudarthrobacter sp. HLT1-5]